MRRVPAGRAGSFRAAPCRIPRRVDEDRRRVGPVLGQSRLPGRSDQAESGDVDRWEGLFPVVVPAPDLGADPRHSAAATPFESQPGLPGRRLVDTPAGHGEPRQAADPVAVRWWKGRVEHPGGWGEAARCRLTHLEAAFSDAGQAVLAKFVPEPLEECLAVERLPRWEPNRSFDDQVDGPDTGGLHQVRQSQNGVICGGFDLTGSSGSFSGLWPPGRWSVDCRRSRRRWPAPEDRCCGRRRRPRPAGLDHRAASRHGRGRSA